MSASTRPSFLSGVRVVRLTEVSEAERLGGLARSKGEAMMTRRFQEWFEHAF